MIAKMREEYEKGGKFAEFVDKGVAAYGGTPEDEYQKEIVKEYYKSVTEGVNKEREMKGGNE